MSFLDLILIAFLISMFFVGFSKGFFSTLYDLISLIIIMVFIYFNIGTFSRLISIYQPTDDPLSQLGGSVVNMVIIFIIMFIILEIVRKLIGVLIKPLFNKLNEHFALTSFLDHILGSLLYMVKGIVIAFIVIALVIIPIFGQDELTDSKIGHLIIEDVPVLSKSFMDEISAYSCILKGADSLQLGDQEALEKMIIATNNAYDLGILSEHDAVKFVYTELGPAILKQPVVLSKEEKEQFSILLNKTTAYSENDRKQILNNIKIGSE